MDKKLLLIIIAGLMVAHTCEAHLDKQPTTPTTLNAPRHHTPGGHWPGDVINGCTVPWGGWIETCDNGSSMRLTPLLGDVCRIAAECHWPKIGNVLSYVDYTPSDLVYNCKGFLTLEEECK